MSLFAIGADMPSYYLDSSALLKRYRVESGSEQLASLIDRLGADERVIVSRLTHVEVSAAITRRAKSSFQFNDALPAVLESLDNDMRYSFDVVEIGESIMFDAIELARVHGLRGADAIQLACGRFARRQLVSQEIHFVACDGELNDAAARDGFVVWDPTAK